MSASLRVGGNISVDVVLHDDCVEFVCTSRTLREVLNGRLHHDISLDKGAIHTLSNTTPNQPLEW